MGAGATGGAKLSIGRNGRLLDDRNIGQVSMANVGAFLLEVHSMQGLACREVARLQDLMEEASARTPEAPSLNLADFKVGERGGGSFFFPRGCGVAVDLEAVRLSMEQHRLGGDGGVSNILYIHK